MKILIVDDSKAMRMIVKRTLRQAGYGEATVEEAANGVEGVAAAKSFNPDIILSDWNMPEMNGLTFLETIRAEGIDTPFGFITTEGTPEMMETAKSSGAQFLITKPFTVETFQEKLGVVV
ncbi:MAG: response regulator [Bacteroidales bacterium]|nr:response regulator [Candidatus Latescibacterota bacterium]